MILSRRALSCVACANGKKVDTPIVNARKAFEAKRMSSLKENFNKMVAIANADAKELVDFVKELDELHKKELMPSSTSTSGKVDPEADSDENIFLNQDS